MTITPTFQLLSDAIYQQNRELGTLFKKITNSALSPEMISILTRLQQDPLSHHPAIACHLKEFLSSVPIIYFETERAGIALSIATLAAQSPVFQRKLEGNWEHHKVQLPNIDPITLDLFAEYNQTGTIDKKRALENFEELLSLAYEWQHVQLIQTLTSMLYSCRSELDSVTKENISSIGEKHNNPALFALTDSKVTYAPHQLEKIIRTEADIQAYLALKNRPQGIICNKWHLEISAWCQGVEELLSASDCPQIVTLRPSRVTQTGYNNLLKALQKSPNLQELTVSGSLTEEHVESIILLIQAQPRLSYLDLSDCSLTAEQLSRITKTLQGHPGIQALRFSHKKLDETNLDSLIYRIEKLHLDDTTTSSELLEELFKENSDRSKLVTLDLSQNSLSSIGEHFLHFLRTTTTLKTLALQNCNLSESALQALIHALLEGKTVCKLQLSENSISDTVATQLATFLRNNGHLQKLFLQNCSLSTKALTSLFNALEENKELTLLDLQNNPMTIETCRVVATLFQHNETLREIDFSDSGLTDEMATILMQAAHHRSRPIKIIALSNLLADSTKESMRTSHDIV